MLALMPSLPLLLGWCAALGALGGGVPPAGAWAVGTLLTAGVVWSTAERFPRNFGAVAAMALLLGTLGSAVVVGRVAFPARPEGRVRGEGSVVAERPWGGRRAVLVAIPSGTFVAFASPVAGLREGDRVAVEGLAQPFRPSRGSSFDAERYWRARGAVGELANPSWTRGAPALGSLAAWRSFLRRRILLTLPPRTRGYVLAALLGVTDPDLAAIHRRAGTVHLLSVSGFHVALVGFFGALCFRGRWRWIGSSALLWGYVALAGAPPSAVRSAVMAQGALLGWALGRRGGVTNALAVAGGGMLLWNPWYFWDVGWRLSVLATMALALLAESRLSPRMAGMLASPGAWIATAGECAAVFGEVPLAGLVVNLVALPAFGVLFPAGILLALPALLGLPGGWLGADLAEDCFTLWEYLSNLLVHLFPGDVANVWALTGVGALTLVVLGGRVLALSSGRVLLVGALTLAWLGWGV